MRATNQHSNRLHFGRYGIAVTLIIMLAGCGGGGNSAGNSTSGSVAQIQVAKNSYKVVEDTYGIQSATYISASRTQNAIVLRTAIASSMTDNAFRTVYRIDIERPETISTSQAYVLGDAPVTPFPFPGHVYIFNGHQSTLLRTISGTVSFTAMGARSGEMISGTFAALVEDGNSNAVPKSTYSIKSDFAFTIDTNGAILPSANPVPASALASYDRNCSSCHALGAHDQTANGATDLSLKGGELNGKFNPDLAGHQGIALTTDGIKELKVLLNAN